MTSDLLHPLNRAIKAEDVATVEQLLKEGADVHAPDARGVTPVREAASRGHTRLLRLLLEAGADPSARPPGGGGWQWPPLACAVAAESRGAVAVLLEYGADPLARVQPGEVSLAEFTRQFWPEREDIAALLEAAEQEPRTRRSSERAV